MVRRIPICRQYWFARMSTIRKTHAQFDRRMSSDPGDCHRDRSDEVACLLSELREHTELHSEIGARVAQLEAYNECKLEDQFSNWCLAQNLLKIFGVAAGITLGVLSFLR